MESLLQVVPSLDITGEALPMELLPFNNDNGQLYGWTLYRKTVSNGGKVNIQGQVRDRAQVGYLDMCIAAWFLFMEMMGFKFHLTLIFNDFNF